MALPLCGCFLLPENKESKNFAIDEYFMTSGGQGNEKLEYNHGFRAHLHMYFGITKRGINIVLQLRKAVLGMIVSKYRYLMNL